MSVPAPAPMSMTDIAIRTATAADAPAIARVRIDSWRTTYRGLVPDAYLDAMDVEASTAQWERVLCAGPGTASIFVATRGDEVVGFAAGNRLREVKHGADAELTAVYLRQQFQRAGIGRRLVAAVVDAQRGQGATAMIVWLIAGNKAARSFYEGLGAQRVIEQPFQWDGLDLAETSYVWRDLPALAAACASVPSSPISILH